MANRASMLTLTIALISMLVLGAGCGGSSTEQPVLDGTTWKLTSWAEPDPIPASVTITAEFADAGVAGTAGINRYHAAITSSTDGSLAVDQVAATLMAGPADVMAAEAAYLKRLQEATSYKVDGNTLVINDADGQPSLTFTRS